MTAPPFCARPVMSSTEHALALEMRRHAEQRADGDDAGAADAGHQDTVGLAESAAAPARADRGKSASPALARCGLRSGRRHGP